MGDTAVRDASANVDQYSTNLHVYVPYRAGLPPLRAYFRELWRRRDFLVEMSRTNMKAEHKDTWFGRIWGLLDPLLVGVTFFFLITVLGVRGGGQEHYFAHLMAGLFLFEVVALSMNSGSRSVTRAGRMVTNIAFPRLMLPLAAVRTAVVQFFPTLPVLVIIGLISGVTPHWSWLAIVPLLAIVAVLGAGVAMLTSTLHVYYRDIGSFLPHISRIWLYSTPVIWMPSMLPPSLGFVKVLNPMYGIVAGWNEAFIDGHWPTAVHFLAPLAWAVALLLIGGYVFLSREREFAVRV